mmetsp:Transcript_61094/g.142324  ORF Transcript_61094/g.142324 Transcript_61094/m.142324 type:complete len:111 (+) Transcript_61094:2-334(+)
MPLHLPRLDWKIWHICHRIRRGEEPPRWFNRLLMVLLQEHEEVLGLLGQPVPFSKPRFVRCRLETRTFSPWCGTDSTWWVARPLGDTTPMDVVVENPLLDGALAPSSGHQ